MTRTHAPQITDFDNGFRMIVWPAFTYIEATDLDTPIRVDEGGEHLGKKTPGVAVAFPTRRHGELHKHFGICDTDEGPVCYGKGASLTASPRAHETLAAARIGGIVTYKGRTYRIREEANQNIALDLID